jgi:hypothetical protein
MRSQMVEWRSNMHACIGSWSMHAYMGDRQMDRFGGIPSRRLMTTARAAGACGALYRVPPQAAKKKEEKKKRRKAATTGVNLFTYAPQVVEVGGVNSRGYEKGN